MRRHHIIQDPSDAAYPEMPMNALRRITPDHVAGVKGMSALLQNLVKQPAGAPSRFRRVEGSVVRDRRDGMRHIDRLAADPF